jgi:hypothetical protein
MWGNLKTIIKFFITIVYFIAIMFFKTYFIDGKAIACLQYFFKNKFADLLKAGGGLWCVY